MADNSRRSGGVTANVVSLRDVISDDIPVFYEHRRDPVASQMAGFPIRTWDAFTTQWAKVLDDQRNFNQTIVVDGQVAGSIASFPEEGARDVGYWLGSAFWGRGIATEALRQFLRIEQQRPLFAYVAVHNIASRRVLEKCGFEVIASNDNEHRLKLDAESE